MGEGTASGVAYVKFNVEGAPPGCFQVSEITLFGDKTVSLDVFLEEKEETPNTFDVGVIAAVATVISLGGFAVSKKRKSDYLKPIIRVYFFIGFLHKSGSPRVFMARGFPHCAKKTVA